MAQRVIGIFISLLFVAVIAYTILNPQTGTGIHDLTLFGEKLVFQFVDVLLLAVLLLGILLSQLLYLKSDTVIYWKISTISIAIFSLLIFLQTVREDKFDLLLIVNILFGFVIYYFAYIFRLRYDFFKWFPFLMLLVIVCVAIVITWSTLTPDHGCSGNFNYDSLPRFDAIFLNPNHLGNVLSFCVVVVFSAVISSRNRIVQLTCWGVLSLLIMGLLSTYSRGAWVGCLTGLIVFLWLILRHGMSGWHVFRHLVTFVVLVFALSLFIPQCRATSERVVGVTCVSDASIGNRLHVWRGTLDMVVSNPLHGVGIGKFQRTFDERFKPRQVSHESYTSTMNNYLNITAEAGIPASCIYLVVLGCILYSALMGIGSSLPKSGIEIGLLSGVVALLIFSCTTYTLTRVYAEVTQWSVLGYLSAGVECPGDTRNS